MEEDESKKSRATVPLMASTTALQYVWYDVPINDESPGPPVVK